MKTAYLPGVVRAEYVREYVVDLTFNDGSQKHVDVSQWFKGPIFEPLRKKAFFKKFFVEAATLAWPNGVDIAPEALYDAADVRKAPAPLRPSRRKAARKSKALRSVRS
jgi:uncharacterized protein DUF2442